MSHTLSSSTLASLLVSISLASGCADLPDDGGSAELNDDGTSELDPDARNGELQLLKALYIAVVRARVALLKIKPMPAAPEIRDELVDLGQKLAFDKLLSGNQNISCMTCHHPLLATDDDLSLSIGEGGVGLGTERVHPEGIWIPRNAPQIFNLHNMPVMFWDGRVETLGPDTIRNPAKEELTPEMLDVFEFGAVSAQAMFPVTSRREMRGRIGDPGNELGMVRDDDFTAIWQALMQRIGTVQEYRDLFEEAYPGTNFEDMTFAHAANAIAAFEIDAFGSNDTPWDRFLRGDNKALTLDQLRGANLFLGRAECVSCHSGKNLSDLSFHNIGLPQFGPGKGDGTFKEDDFGRQRVSKSTDDRYHFRTAPLRNVALTGPWGHAGQFTDLADFVDHYIDPETSLNNYDVTQIHPSLQPTLVDNKADVLAHLSPELASIDLDHDEVPFVVDFLHALTDPKALDLEDTIPETVPSGLPVPETVVTNIENRAGTLHMTMGFDTSGAREYQIQEPSMCDGEASAQLNFDRNAGTLSIDASFDGLPYRPSYCYDYDPSSAYNQYPECVDDGRWQIWFVGRNFTKRSIFWYDGATGNLIGNELDIVGPLPPTAFPLELPVLQMVCTDFFESDPDTLQANVHFDFDYHQILDNMGNGGVYVGALPPNLFNPTDLIVYYTQGGLAPELAMDFDDTIEEIAEGKGGVMVVTSYEPYPKPSYLDSRDNIMVGWGAAWPIPDPLLTKPVECGTNFQWQGDFGL